MLHALFLTDYRLPVSIGILSHERAAPQTIRVDITLLVDREIAGDSITGVVDYDFLREGIAALAGRGHFETQEALCAAILALCRGHGGPVGARVSTQKPDVYPDAAGVGCRMLWLDPAVDRTSGALLMAG
mgnify:CR=1 FL=1